ncbi:hypothetical protein RRF57_012292 [Xylaria bambusicola]|uniref:Uncharacterized protein n=1 Tax=Xylaria bambusicola TaxID=326684 RepID=A0AAN7UPE3_9PEZI
MSTKNFEDFLYKGQPLDQEGPIPDELAQCTTDMQKTGWAVKKLIAFEDEFVQGILAKSQVSSIPPITKTPLTGCH